MSYSSKDRRHSDLADNRSDVSRGTPGRRPRTASLPQRPPAAASPAPVQRAVADTAATDAWTDVAFRPDLPTAPVQRKADPGASGGLPGPLKAGIESLSGLSMDDVKVHYGSSKPADVQAKAYTQGTDIHVGPGQEGHLPHEAWHVVQQKQGRVAPTIQTKGVDVNDDASLEREADVMGARALETPASGDAPANASVGAPTVQRVGDKMAVTYETVTGEKIEALQEGVRAIYEKHKAAKKAKRDKLDQDFRDQSADLEDRQSYLMIALEVEVMKVLNTDDDAPDFAAQIKSVGKKLAKSPLSKKQKSELDTKASSLAGGIATIVKEKMDERAKAGKRTNKASWRSKIGEYTREHGRHAIADPIVEHYETGYMASGMSKNELLAEWVAFANGKGFDLVLITEKSVGEVVVWPSDDPDKDVQIATVYFDDARFVKKSEIVLNQGTDKEEVREIFAHRDSGKEYVLDAFDRYVRRYVNRALNKYDNPSPEKGVSIKADPRKKKGSDQTWSQIATQVPTMDQEDQSTEIRKHQRSKEVQGGSPFISFGATDRPIFGSSAKLFEGDQGVATVDLAQISKNSVFDTHTPEALEQIHGISNPDPTMKFVEGDDLVERNIAARDAMRTREVVVAGDVPDEAITAVKVKGEEYVKSMDGKFKPKDQMLKELSVLMKQWFAGLGHVPKDSSPPIEDID